MKASNSQTFPIDHASLPTFSTVFIGAQHLRAPDRQGRRAKKQSTTECLLIGFDTEYQTFEPVDRGGIERGEAKNEILSYQFCVKLVSAAEAGEAPEASGIIVPDGNDRLDLGDFIVFALGTLVAKYPTVIIPSDIYLIGHFTRADLPAFAEFSDTARRLLSNVRNTFVSLGEVVFIEIMDEDGSVGSIRVRLRDTMLLAPANAKSLADIGEIVGFEKIKLDEDREKDLHIKRNMRAFREANWEHFKDYAIRDAEVCVRYAEKVIHQFHSLFGEFQLPITLTQFGTRLVLQSWKEAGCDADDLLGRETVKENRFSTKRGYSIETPKHPFIEEVFYEAAFVTETYHGGRNEQFAFGICPESDWRDHDLSSAYTTAMSLIGHPSWKGIERLISLDDVGPLDLAFFSIEFEFPETVRFPTLPVRTPNGIIFPRKGTSLCSAPEVFLAQKLGAKLQLRRGIRVPTERSQRVFKGFIETAIAQRGKHPKGSFENLFWKEVGNSTYGKTAQGLREKRVYDLKSDDMVALPESKITQPFFASFITSFTRAVLGEVLNGFSPSVRVFSVTTDGFLSNACDLEIAAACEGDLFQAFATARKALDETSTPLEIKHQIRQPIGWRTRGSGTLKQGTAGKARIVLQKGGIKTDALLDLDEENRHVIDLFLNRFPTQQLNYTVGVGLKDMVRFDADFVSRSVTKRLSMEYDWKRKPVNIRDETVEFQGQSYTHLSFDTEPHDDFDAFRKVREAWDTYDRKPRQNLKSVSDFNRFWGFLETRKHPDKECLRYMRKGGEGDLERLNRDLCRAFVHHQAGFDLINAKLRINYADFVRRLTSCGIPCTIDTVDYAKRKLFTPHQTIPTSRVISLINLLRSTQFPELDVDLILNYEMSHYVIENP